MNVLSPEYICNRIYSGVVLCLIKNYLQKLFCFHQYAEYSYW